MENMVYNLSELLILEGLLKIFQEVDIYVDILNFLHFLLYRVYDVPYSRRAYTSEYGMYWTTVTVLHCKNHRVLRGSAGITFGR